MVVFPDNTTASKVNTHNSTLLEIVAEKLNCSSLASTPHPSNSMMTYGDLCGHDDGFLCEHRLQAIIDFIHTYEDD